MRSALALDEPLSLSDLSDLDDNGQVQGYLFGKHYALAEWRHKKEQQEFENFCRRLQGLPPLAQPDTLQYDEQNPNYQRLLSRIQETDRRLRERYFPVIPVSRENLSRRGRRLMVDATNCCEARCLSDYSYMGRPCNSLGSFSRDNRRVCWMHSRATKVEFVEAST